MVDKTFPILFITATRIGDAVLATGLIHKLIQEVPGARFTIAAGPAAAPLFEDVPGLDEIIVMTKARRGGHWFDLWRKTRKRDWGLVVDLRGSLTALFLKRKRRAILQKRPDVLEHKVIEAARLLKIEAAPPAPHLYISESRKAAALRRMEGDGPILALGPASNWVGKMWPVDRFARVALSLTAPDGPMAGARIAVFGSSDDSWVTHELIQSLPSQRTIDLTGRVDLLTAAACLARTRLYIGNDSGLMHMAAAVGTPTLGLFGPSDERRYGPWGVHCRAVRGTRSFDDFLAIDPDLVQEMTHMNDLTVDKVLGAARDLLQQGDQGS